MNRNKQRKLSFRSSLASLPSVKNQESSPFSQLPPVEFPERHEKRSNYRSLTLMPCPCPVFVAIPPSKDTSATSDPSDNSKQTCDSYHSSHQSHNSPVSHPHDHKHNRHS